MEANLPMLEKKKLIIFFWRSTYFFRLKLVWPLEFIISCKCAII